MRPTIAFRHCTVDQMLLNFNMSLFSRIEPSKFFYNLVAQYPSQMYGTQPLLTSFFNTMMNNPLNTPVSVSTPPINPMASSQPVVNTSTAPSSRGDGNAYNGNPYYQTQNSGPPNTPIHRNLLCFAL